MITKEKIIERLTGLEREINRLKVKLQNNKGTLRSEEDLAKRKEVIGRILSVETDFESWSREKEKIIKKRAEDIVSA